ncbi:hypothetical protein ACP4OV_001242 [Aristida adscensionis]
MASSSPSSMPTSSTGSLITVATPPPAGGGGGGGAGSPCAACKFLRRKCQPDCVFAPYFPPDQPQKFVHVHRVFGASNVTKILNDLHPSQREDAVNSLAFEADSRLRDPVYGCVGIIVILQHRLRLAQQELDRARLELAKYQAAAAASAAVGSNGAAAMVADFAGIPAPNCTQNFINIGPAIGAAGFVENDHFVNVSMLMRRSYEGETTAETTFGMNGRGGGYGAFAYSSAMGAGAMSGLGPIISGGPFLKPDTAGSDERHTTA